MVKYPCWSHFYRTIIVCNIEYCTGSVFGFLSALCVIVHRTTARGYVRLDKFALRTTATTINGKCRTVQMSNSGQMGREDRLKRFAHHRLSPTTQRTVSIVFYVNSYKTCTSLNSACRSYAFNDSSARCFRQTL